MNKKIILLFLFIILSSWCYGCSNLNAHSSKKATHTKKILSVKAENVPVLIYHHITPSINKVNIKTAITIKEFEWQMNYIYSHKYRVISLKKLYEHLRDKKGFKHKSIVITFDDGYEDNYKYAYPILKKYKFTSMIFLIGNKIGKSKLETGYDGMKARWRILSLSQIKTMMNNRIEFGAHTMNHINLTKVEKQRASHEVAASKTFLQKRLGVKIYAFSYPYGKSNKLVRNIVKKSGYVLAVNSSEKKDHVNTEQFDINRVDVGGNMSHKKFLKIFKTK